ncbi:Crp/Fnr family transcriptional regulator (plasmid) [Salipiger sp. H15]|uniref:Crp/Fnr family transcriptional regulator n=1 Tax=Alloyangia sp. H15 TaxID=3029062 RepID=A0AAU8ASS9_9RHOB
MMHHQSDTGRCRHCAARRSGFCSLLDPHSVEELASRSTLAEYPRETEIVLQGEPLDKVGIIASGMVKLGTVTEGGDEHLLQITRSGQLISVPENTRSRYSWVTVTDTKVCWMPRSTWDQFLQEQPHHFRCYMVMMRYQLEQMQLSVMNMRGRSTLQRLAFWILDELAASETGETGTLHIRLSRRDLASLLDMTVETLCRSLHKLHDKRAIELLSPDHLNVLDPMKLRLVARSHEEGFEAPLAQPQAVPSARDWTNWSAATPSAARDPRGLALQMREARAEGDLPAPKPHPRPPGKPQG